MTKSQLDHIIKRESEGWIIRQTQEFDGVVYLRMVRHEERRNVSWYRSERVDAVGSYDILSEVDV